MPNPIKTVSSDIDHYIMVIQGIFYFMKVKIWHFFDNNLFSSTGPTGYVQIWVNNVKSSLNLRFLTLLVGSVEGNKLFRKKCQILTFMK